jgi:hypothetical protein
MTTWVDSCDIFDQELQQLTKDVHHIMDHKLLGEMNNLRQLENKLKLKEKWKLDFTKGVKIQYTLAEKDKDKDKDKEKKEDTDKDKDKVEKNIFVIKDALVFNLIDLVTYSE